MILTKTPYRVSLFGGGTDYPAWYRDNGGFVVGMAITKYCYLAVKDTPVGQGFKFRVAYRQVEDCMAISDIQHPGARGVLQHVWNDGRGVEIVHTGDMPAMSGLGSSSSYVVGLTAALHGLARRAMPDPATLASTAIHVERSVIGEAVGDQDQHFAAFGGLRSFSFHGDGLVATRELAVPNGFLQELESWCVLAYTGQMRHAHVMAGKVVKVLEQRGTQIKEHMLAILELAREGGTAVLLGDILRVAYLLDRQWYYKAAMHPDISNTQISELYQHGKKCGALGGKLLGAGGGGFMLFLVPPKHHEYFIHDINVPCATFGIDHHGCQVVINEPSTP